MRLLHPRERVRDLVPVQAEPRLDEGEVFRLLPHELDLRLQVLAVFGEADRMVEVSRIALDELVAGARFEDRSRVTEQVVFGRSLLG